MSHTYKDPINCLSRMLHAELGEYLTPAEDFIDMFDKNGVMEFPYTPETGVQTIEGRDEMKDYFAHVRGMIVIRDIMNPQTYICQDGKNVIIEFECQGKIVATGRPYNQKYVSVIRLTNGKIRRYRDYWNPQVLMNALAKEDI